LDGFLEILQITISDCLLDLGPAVGWFNIWELAAVDLSRILALKSAMTLLLAVCADLRRLIRAVGRTMTDLLTDTAGAREFSCDSFVGAICLVVTRNC
jgi:hypothetical protein